MQEQLLLDIIFTLNCADADLQGVQQREFTEYATCEDLAAADATREEIGALLERLAKELEKRRSKNVRKDHYPEQ